MAGRKAIFITGAASGIGRATAELFAKRGWVVGLADVNPEGLDETAALLPSGQAKICRLDVRDRAAWDEALGQFTKESGGSLDVLFNNAGVGRGGPFAELSHDDHDLVIDVNIKGVINGAEAGFKYLRDTPGACLLNTCSAAGMVAGPGMTVYAVSKFGVRALTESLELEWREYDIRVCSLMPSFIETPLLNSTQPGSNQNIRETVVASGLEITPVSEVAEAAWNAVHGTATHTMVGKTARRARFMTRWLPGTFRKMMARQIEKGRQS